jgi:superoxide dismutase
MTIPAGRPMDRAGAVSGKFVLPIVGLDVWEHAYAIQSRLHFLLSLNIL